MMLDYRYPHIQQLRASLAFLVQPLHLLADLPISTSLQFQKWVISRQKLMDENERLHIDNFNLKGDLQKYAALQAENTRLRNLLDSSLKVGERILIAELSTVDLDPYRQQVMINKGSRSGVFAGQPVLNAEAVMGQVTQVNPFSSIVLLITDANHSVPVQILRNGLRTIAVGSGKVNELQLPYLSTDADIVVGDLLVTSGLGGKFPAGYPVASVTHIDRAPDNPFAKVLAHPTAHLDRSREVLLVWTIDAHATETRQLKQNEQPN